MGSLCGTNSSYLLVVPLCFKAGKYGTIETKREHEHRVRDGLQLLRPKTDKISQGLMHLPKEEAHCYSGLLREVQSVQQTDLPYNANCDDTKSDRTFLQPHGRQIGGLIRGDLWSPNLCLEAVSGVRAWLFAQMSS